MSLVLFNLSVAARKEPETIEALKEDEPGKSATP